MTIAPLNATHLEAAAQLWRAESEQALGRLRWHLHTPYAKLLGAHAQGTLSGVIGGLQLGTHARITVMRTRTGDVAAALVHAWMEAWMAEGGTHFTVTVPLTDVAQWSAMGFVAQEQLIRYTGGRFIEATHDEVVHYEPYHRMGVLLLDQQASGEARHELLMEHAYLGQVYLLNGVVRGFALPLLGHGLIVSNDATAGLELQRWLFPVQDYVLLPEGSAAHAHLIERGYRADAIGVRMVHGTAPATRSQMVFAEPFSVV